MAFDPAAVAVDAGTTVTWEWTGRGGEQDVVAVGVRRREHAPADEETSRA
ncbi:halocyanin 2 [Candidatus Halobonum tyrrellensis G22]|uniref:Halocyanin 2 n=1 Tax=Candidatus Halobonum tyrrellensis G22 TaxID=1324957 RepID=V4J3T8_9EURY|nr:halocyanin 2 [Candidatus Halobonum tyrrellensis G22]